MKKRVINFCSVFAVLFLCCVGCQTTVSAANAAETPADQFLYQYNSTYQGIELTKYLGKDVIVNIPVEIGGIPVTVIGVECFSKNKNLKELFMPNTVTVIRTKAFYECSELENISWSENLKNIGRQAFSYCNIKSVFMPDSLTFLGDEAFTDCQALEEVTCSNNLTELNGTFLRCRNLKIVQFPNSPQFTKIGRGAFSGCTIEKIEIPASVTEICEYAFSSSVADSNVMELIFPKDSKLKKIEDYAFKYCSFNKVTLPASLEEIGREVFSHTKELKKILFEKNAKIKEIPACAFAGCMLLEEVDIPENITKIDADLFYDSNHGIYNKVKKINIKGGKIKKIGETAFKGLAKNGKITVPKKYKKKYTKMFKKQKWYKKTMRIIPVKKIKF